MYAYAWLVTLEPSIRYMYAYAWLVTLAGFFISVASDPLAWLHVPTVNTEIHYPTRVFSCR